MSKKSKSKNNSTPEKEPIPGEVEKSDEYVFNHGFGIAVTLLLLPAEHAMGLPISCNTVTPSLCYS